MSRLEVTNRTIARLLTAAIALPIPTLLPGCRTREAISTRKTEIRSEDGIERGYFLKDTFSLPAGPNEYHATKLYRGSNLIDTIFVGAGLGRIDSERIAYERIQTSIESVWNAAGDTLIETFSSSSNGGITVFDGKARRAISDKLAHYGSFSSPLLMDGNIYYWGLKKRPDSAYRIFAMRFEVLTERTDSLFLFEAELGTDDEGYFSQPYWEDGGLIYEAEQEQQRWKLDVSFRNAERMTMNPDSTR